MRKLQLLLMIGVSGLSITACGSAEYEKIGSEFLPYVETYEREVGGSAAELTVKFADRDHATMRPRELNRPVTLGICYISSIGNLDAGRRIEINPHTWPELDESEREAIMFHELGHCVHTLDHVDDRLHVMNSMVPLRQWWDLRDSLIQGLIELIGR